MTRWTRRMLRQLKTLRGLFASVPERDVGHRKNIIIKTAEPP